MLMRMLNPGWSRRSSRLPTREGSYMGELCGASGARPRPSSAPVPLTGGPGGAASILPGTMLSPGSTNDGGMRAPPLGNAMAF